MAARAGARWSEEEDVILADSWNAGKATSAIAERLRRSESAIIARLIGRDLAELRHTRAEKQTERGSL
ncbi:hypothetical protein FGG78_41525 [Thioclava sp. BHET1]|nr:hypothetical protein FGG78_41525 [Thioclava sp. BHET1]